LLGIEAGEYSRISQLLIRGEKDAVLRSVFTLFQRRSQLNRVRGSQVEAIHKFDRRRAHTFRSLNYGPQSGKFFGHISGFGPVEGIEFLHSLKSGQRTCYLDGCRPPHDDVIGPIEGNRVRRCALPHAKWNESTCVPKRWNSRYRPSRSSRNICFTTSSETFPGAPAKRKKLADDSGAASEGHSQPVAAPVPSVRLNGRELCALRACSGRAPAPLHHRERVEYAR
jgi:hypothetical protein